MATPLILDVDTGIDDAIALLYAAASPEVELIGATCVAGNVAVDQVAENTLVVLERAGLAGVEVAVGAERPLARALPAARAGHGPHGLGRATPGSPVGAPSPRSAWELIATLARERPGEILLVATGPLTNVARALETEPGLPELLRGLASMGGVAVGASAEPIAGTNARIDPEAAAAVARGFAATPMPAGLRCVGSDVTERLRLTHADLDRIVGAARASQLARLIVDAVGFAIEERGRRGEPPGAPIHDATTLALAIDPGLARWDRREGGSVAVDVDADRVRRRLVDRLGALVRDRARATAR